MTSILLSFFSFRVILVASCDFEKSICGFTQDINDNFDWTRHKGSTSSWSTGPSADYTTGAGLLPRKSNYVTKAGENIFVFNQNIFESSSAIFSSSLKFEKLLKLHN